MFVTRYVACLFLVGILAAHAHGDPINLLPQGNFAKMEAGAPPKDWEPQQKWMHGRLQVVQKDGRVFIRATEAPAIITTRLAVPDALRGKELTIRYEVNLREFQPGGNQWATPMVRVAAVDASGKGVGQPARSAVKEATDGWVTRESKWTVPQEAQALDVTISHKGGKGIFEIANLQLMAEGVSPSTQPVPPATPAPAAAGPAPAAPPQAAVQDSLSRPRRDSWDVVPTDRSKITGASTDEKQVQVTLQGNPEQGFKAVMTQAVEHLREGKGVKVVLAPGVYRESFELDGSKLGPGRKALLIIEGTAGKTILSGSDVWTPDRFTPVMGADGSVAFYQAPWPHKMELFGGPWGQYNPKAVPGHRSELVIVNGEILKPVMLDQYKYTPDKGWGGSGKHAYEGFAAPAEALAAPGTFGVSDHQEAPADYAERLFVRPPQGVDWSTATIEVAMRPQILWINHKDNVVLRGLTFQHSTGSSRTRDAAVFVGNWFTDLAKDGFVCNNILIEDCVFQANNTFGLKANRVKDFTMRRSASRYNGFSGANMGMMRNVLIEDVDFNFNNWRGWLGGLTGWAVAGIKTHSTHDAVYSRVNAYGNLAPGLWWDIANSNIVIEDCVSVGNKIGCFLEISHGPFLVTRSLLARNAPEPGFQINNAMDVILENSIVYGNGLPSESSSAVNQQICVVSSQRDSGNPVGVLSGEPDKIAYQNGPMILRSNLIASARPDVALFAQKTGNAQRYHEFLRTALVDQNNRWVAPNPESAFGFGQAHRDMGGWPRWQETVKVDSSRVVNSHGLSNAEQLDFTPSAGASIDLPKLPTRRIDPRILQEMQAFFVKWNWVARYDYADHDINPQR